MACFTNGWPNDRGPFVHYAHVSSTVGAFHTRAESGKLLEIRELQSPPSASEAALFEGHTRYRNSSANLTALAMRACPLPYARPSQSERTRHYKRYKEPTVVTNKARRPHKGLHTNSMADLIGASEAVSAMAWSFVDIQGTKANVSICNREAFIICSGHDWIGRFAPSLPIRGVCVVVGAH
jgi:hypothetical protein